MVASSGAERGSCSVRKDRAFNQSAADGALLEAAVAALADG